MSTIKKGDKVEILIGGSDSSKFGMAPAMRGAKGYKAAVQSVDSSGNVVVSHPLFPSTFTYSSSEVRKVDTARTQEFKRGDRVKITRHGAYGSNSRMDEGLGGYGEVLEAEYPGRVGCEARIRVYLDNGLGTHVYDHGELETVVKLRGFKADTVIVDDPAAEHIQSHDELVAENESLAKQIRKLEARVERKKEFQRQNVRKIAAWQVILEK